MKRGITELTQLSVKKYEFDSFQFNKLWIKFTLYIVITTTFQHFHPNTMIWWSAMPKNSPIRILACYYYLMEFEKLYWLIISYTIARMYGVFKTRWPHLNGVTLTSWFEFLDTFKIECCAYQLLKILICKL